MVCSSPPLPQTSRHAEKEVQCLGLELMQERENMNSVLKGPIDDVRSHPGRVETHHPPTLTCQWGLPTKDGSVPLPLRTAWSVPFPPNTKDPEVCPMTPSLSALITIFSKRKFYSTPEVHSALFFVDMLCSYVKKTYN